MSDQLARDLELLAELFKAGGWRELRVESPGVSVLFSTDADAASLGATATDHAVILREPSSVSPAVATVPVAVPMLEAAVSDVSIDPAWHAVTAPNLGTFYRAPKPGADPFVEIGQRVAPDTEICLLEVMKLFTSVKAGVAGTVAWIAAADAELVEGGQILFYIQTD